LFPALLNLANWDSHSSAPESELLCLRGEIQYPEPELRFPESLSVLDLLSVPELSVRAKFVPRQIQQQFQRHRLIPQFAAPPSLPERFYAPSARGLTASWTEMMKELYR
jgi:hypothetical protein